MKNNYTITSDINVYLSNSSQRYLFTAMEPLKAKTADAKNDDSVMIINVDPGRIFQEIDGFGASFTDSSAYLVAAIPDPDIRDEVMTNLFDLDKGIGLSVLRQTMGACDFSRELYNYDDLPPGEEDARLEHFSISYDEKEIIPLLRQALDINPEMKIMASPWSPPGWMKTGGSMIGGSLRRECYAVYANYFVKFIQAYEEAGIRIVAVTPQNEPLYVPPHYPGMSMPMEAQVEFINEHLGPAFESNGITAKILAYDHNWDRPDYPLHVLELTGKYTAGVAWHHYGGAPKAQTQVREAFPDKEVYFTEGSGGEWVPPFQRAFFEIIDGCIQIMRNWSKCYIMWNVALDENNGPMPLTENPTCRGILTIDSVTREVTYNLDYYAIAHFSKFIKPRSVRIESDSYDNKVHTLAAMNTDGSVALVAYNKLNNDVTIRVVFGDKMFEYELMGKSVTTFYWT